MNRRTILSGVYGAAVVAIAIWLDAHGRKLEGQVVVLTAFALAAPVGVAVITEGLRQRAFRVALASCALIHALFLWKMAGSLPFPTLGVTILLGLAEGLMLVILSAKITEIFNNREKSRL